MGTLHPGVHPSAHRKPPGFALESLRRVELLHSVITLLFTLWYAEIAVKAIAAYRLYHARLVREFPFLFVFLITSTLKSLILVQLRQVPSAYARVYSLAIPVMLVLQFVCAIEVFERLMHHRVHFERVGRMLLAGFAMVGVAASIATKQVWVPATWQGTREAAVLLDRYGLLSLLVAVLLMGVVVPGRSSVPIPRNARRAALILGWYVLGNGICAVLLVGSGAARRLVPAYVTVITGLTAGVAWATLLQPVHEAVPPEGDPGRAERAWNQYVRFIEALRSGARAHAPR